MRKVLFYFQLTIAFAIGLLSCEHNPISGGTGTETINTFAKLSDGTPARGASVLLIDASGWIDSIRQGASPVLERGVTDSNGRVELIVPKTNSTINIQIDHIQQGALLSTILPDNDTIHLQPYASFTGAFSDSTQQISRLFLSGSAYSAWIGSSGNFYFDKVAPGSFTVLGSTGLQNSLELGGTVTLSAGAKIVDTTLNASANRLLLDNFETGVGPTALGYFIPLISWYAVSDSGLLTWNPGFNTFDWTDFNVTPRGRSFISLAPIAGDNGGTAMSFTARLSNAAKNIFTTAGISFTNAFPGGVDLSSMTGLSLRCKGNGVLWIKLRTRKLDSATKATTPCSYTYTLNLTNTMTLYQLPVDSLRIVPVAIPKQQYPWASESKNVESLDFEFSVKTNSIGVTMNMVVDDIYLEGVGLSAFVP
jgi:hypothetical protein